MKKHIGLLTLLVSVAASAQETTRIPQFSNDKTNVWKTIIYPTAAKELSMHRHEFDRVLVALTSGTLKVTNQEGQSHDLKLQKNHAYYLEKDPPGELHKDVNISQHPITVMVIELK